MGGTDLDDDALMARIAAGDASAFTRAVDQHGPMTLRVARRVLRDERDAEDAVQDAFAALWRTAGRWRPGRARLSTWLCQVALNACRDQLRRRVRRPEIPLPTGVEEFLTDPNENAEQALATAQRRRALEREIAALPERQRLAMALAYEEDLPDAEAAQAMGVSVKAYESLLVRARRTLRAALTDGEGDAP